MRASAKRLPFLDVSWRELQCNFSMANFYLRLWLMIAAPVLEEVGEAYPVFYNCLLVVSAHLAAVYVLLSAYCLLKSQNPRNLSVWTRLCSLTLAAIHFCIYHQLMMKVGFKGGEYCIQGGEYCIKAGEYCLKGSNEYYDLFSSKLANKILEAISVLVLRSEFLEAYHSEENQKTPIPAGSETRDDEATTVVQLS